jgi:hypothetical protein
MPSRFGSVWTVLHAGHPCGASSVKSSAADDLFGSFEIPTPTPAAPGGWTSFESSLVPASGGFGIRFGDGFGSSPTPASNGFGSFPAAPPAPPGAFGGASLFDAPAPAPAAFGGNLFAGMSMAAPAVPATSAAPKVAPAKMISTWDMNMKDVGMAMPYPLTGDAHTSSRLPDFS